MQLRAKLHRFIGTPDELSRALAAAAASDKRAESRAARAGGGGCLLLLVGLGGACVANEVFDSAERTVALIAAAGVVAAIIAWVAAGLFSRGDVEDRKLAAAQRFVAMIRADAPARSRLRLEVDFRSYDKATRPSLDRKQPELRFMLMQFHRRTRRWTHTWFRALGALADGTRFEVRAGETLTRREKPVVKSRPGKTKLKTKVRLFSAGRLQVSLRLATGQAEAAAAALADVAPPAPLRRGRVRARGRRLVATALLPRVQVPQTGGSRDEPAGRLSGDHVLQALVWVYAGLGRAASGGPGDR